jgi:ATP-dependent DNA ligase
VTEGICLGLITTMRSRASGVVSRSQASKLTRPLTPLTCRSCSAQILCAEPAPLALPRYGVIGNQSQGGGRPASDWVPLQPTRLVDAAPGGDAWLHEIKFDGYRSIRTSTAAR